MTETLTEEQRDAMAHCIGHHSAKGCSGRGGRNHYVTQANDPVWEPLVERGLAEVRRSSLLPDAEAVYRLTEAGRAALEADPRSARKGRLYTVKFRGYERGVQVYAETRSKAKYAAVRDLLDAWNCDRGDLFREIESCRLGYW